MKNYFFECECLDVEIIINDFNKQRAKRILKEHVKNVKDWGFNKSEKM